jgi:hypothetical protein
MEEEKICCPPFDPKPWDDKEIVWKDKLFVKDRVRSIFHIPLNFGAVMIKNMAKIEAAGVSADEAITLCDENSPWGADVYIAVDKIVPNAEMAKLNGTFLSKVFEGPYSKMGGWIKEMTGYVKGKGKEIGKLYFYYTTCPNCAKKYGKNYVALLAKI